MSIKPTCREVQGLVSKGLDSRLTVTERIRMRLHLLVCIGCTRVQKQMELMRRAMQRFSDDK